MASRRTDFAAISGTFFRVIFEHRSISLLSGVTSHHGRYHHDGEPALYLSSRPDWAWHAVEPYIRPGEPARTMQKISVCDARVVDIRNAEMCRQLGIEPADSTTPWQPQLNQGTRPSTWTVSDRARAAGADGLIYTARATPDRWHLVLFCWNGLGGPTVASST